jgi:hypothetical protein
MNPLFLVLELGAAAFFVVAGWLALRRGRLPFLELMSAASFGLLLEQGDQLIFETYHYSPDFVLAIDRAPLAIGLTWALIIAGAMRITDALGVRRRYAPFVDSLLAISLDLAFDAIAIRLGLWTWRGMTLEAGWFGVPAGNYFAWLFVTFGFSLVTRWLREASRGRPGLEWLQLLVPIPAFALLLLPLWPFVVLRPLIDPAPGSGWVLLGIAFTAFVAIGAWAVWGPDRARPDGAADAILDLRLAFATRVVIQLVFLIAFVIAGLVADAPPLMVVALVLLALEAPLAVLAHRRLRAVETSHDPSVHATVRA